MKPVPALSCDYPLYYLFIITVFLPVYLVFPVHIVSKHTMLIFITSKVFSYIAQYVTCTSI